MIAAIHQPNFFPWLGYFRKIARADKFVFLDSVQFPQTSRGCWTNRVKLLINGEAKWFTCPIQRESGKVLIRDVKMDTHCDWRNKFLKCLELNYSQTPCYKEVFPFVKIMINESQEETRLSNFNIKNIIALSRKIGLNSEFIRCSDLPNPEIFRKTGSERLALICESLKVDTYLSGDGAESYEKPEAYRARGIQVIKSQFQPEPYFQSRSQSFVAGLSIVDALFSIGFSGVRSQLFNF